MPWHESERVNERMRFVVQAQQGMYSMSELCDRYGISRQTGYATLRRYARLGLDGLKERSHAPHRCPHRICAEAREILLAARRAHPNWGPRKILAWLRLRQPDWALPAPSTVGDLYRREQLSKPRRRPRRWCQPGRASLPVSTPNDLWTIDFKGQFRMRNGQYCYPLTIADLHTRFVLAIDALSSTGYGGYAGGRGARLPRVRTAAGDSL